MESSPRFGNLIFHYQYSTDKYLPHLHTGLQTALYDFTSSVVEKIEQFDYRRALSITNRKLCMINNF